MTYSDRFKRPFDVLVATVGLVLLLPVLLGIACWVRVDSPGPVLFRHTRVGRQGRLFRMHKFRTMVPDAEALLTHVRHGDAHTASGDARLHKIPGDPRVTRAGAVLRRWSLDELPQLVDVLRGEMSLVGPRPLTPEEDGYVTGAAAARRNVRPGVTGPWQVGGRNALSFRQMTALDLAYALGPTFLGDLRLLVRTVGVVLHPEDDC